MTTVKKKLPYELYDVAGLEDWFSRMAAEGYHLEDCWENQAEFRVEEPKKNVRFRLEAQGTYEYDWNQDEAYAAGGWEHVTTIRGFFYVFRCDDPTARELHTDPKIQSWTMRKLIWRQSLGVLALLVLWGVNFSLRLKIFDLNGLREFAAFVMLEDAVLLIVSALVPLVAHFLAVQANQITMLVRLKRRLASGLPMDREKHYPRSFWRHGFQRVLICAALISMFAGALMYQREPAQVEAADYPHVALEEVVPEGYFGEPMQYFKQAELESSLLVPVQLRYAHRAFRNDEEGNRARIYLDYSEARFPEAAKIILRSMLYDQERGLKTEREWQEKYPDKFDRFALDTGAVRTAHEALDELWVWDVQYENDDRLHRHYFGRKGNVAFELTTTLPEPEAALEVLVERLEG